MYLHSTARRSLAKDVLAILHHGEPLARGSARARRHVYRSDRQRFLDDGLPELTDTELATLRRGLDGEIRRLSELSGVLGAVLALRHTGATSDASGARRSA